MPVPLTLLKTGESSLVTRVGGNPATRQFLEGLGFVVGTPVSVVSEIDGNLICSIKNTRVAIGKDMAKKNYV
jgi:ferrous iron transport protein A